MGVKKVTLKNKKGCKYLIWCINVTKTTMTKRETFSLSAAQRIYANAVKSGIYYSVTLRKEENTRGYAIKSWSKENGEVLYFSNM